MQYMTIDPARVLVVDDTPENRDLLSRRIVQMGHAVEFAEDGKQALAAMHKTAFDLVLLDIMMPQMNGYEVLEYLRKDATLRHVPVIVISALSELEERGAVHRTRPRRIIYSNLSMLHCCAPCWRMPGKEAIPRS